MKIIALIFFALYGFSSVDGWAAQAAVGAEIEAAATFQNPLLPSGPDPWVTYHDGFYYYMNTTQANLTIWKTRDITDLKDAEKKVVWTAPATGPYSHDVWAPELHYLRGAWYIYFAADAGTNDSHRLYVLENKNADPLSDHWQLKGRLHDSNDHWAIDASVVENHGQLYLAWSGWSGDLNGVQHIYLARMSNPWTVDGKGMILSTPQYPWEKVGDQIQHSDLPHIDVNEGPEFLQHEGKIFVIYSASGCWTDYYELGMVEASAADDLMKASSWKKRDKPVFRQSPEASVFATGHNSFFTSPDGKESWILYHANSSSGQGCGATRSPRAQPFKWNADGTPDFGSPIATAVPIRKPSGQQ
jgi:GH43 family beta-xylosidase